IDAFLAQRSESDGGYAPVADGDTEALYDIVGQLIELKYENDPDGDRPVQAYLVDLTRFERPMLLQVPRTGPRIDPALELALTREALRRHAMMSEFHAAAVKRLAAQLDAHLHAKAEAHAALTV